MSPEEKIKIQEEMVEEKSENIFNLLTLFPSAISRDIFGLIFINFSKAFCNNKIVIAA